MEFNIADVFEGVADAVPDRLALTADDRRFTYRQLDERVNRAGHALVAAGVAPQEHVGILAFNCTEWVETFLACCKVRAVGINVNYRYVEDELRYLFDNADLTALVLQRQFAPRVASVVGGLPKLRTLVVIEDGSGASLAGLDGVVMYDDALAEGSPSRDFAARSGDDLYILYTGGTTGMPKGVMWRQEDVIMTLGSGFDPMTGEKKARPEVYAEKAGESAGGLVMFPLPPLMHGAGQWGVLNGFFSGNTVVLNTRPSFDADATWEIAAREKVNVISITGDAMGRPLADALATKAATGSMYDLSSLITITSTAAVFSLAVKDLVKEHLPNLLLSEAIGASETGTNGLAVRGEAPAGRGGPNVNPSPGTAVLTDDGKPVAPGEVGWLARSGNVPLGYYKDPEKSAKTFPVIDGVRYSIPGDYARLEEDGTVTLLGRGSVCINTGGEKVYPEEVEQAVKSHPDVFDAIVVGVPDDRFGQRVAVVAAARPGRVLDLDTISSHCRTQIAGYKVPRELHVVDEVQRQPSGKPDYPWAQDYARSRSSSASASPTGAAS